MKYLLGAGQLEALAHFASSRVLVAFDFDGTLAPIIANRDLAKMRKKTHGLLKQVSQLYPTAVISGRSRHDVKRKVAGIRLRHVVGNHGLEPSEHLMIFKRQIDLIRPQLLTALEGCSGLDLEDKRFSLTVHYRRSRRPAAARRAIHRAVRALSVPMQLVPGKLVANVIPLGAPHKGDALIRLLEQEDADTAMYVGDDVTDEHVFELGQPERLLTIRVGQSASSSASYYLRNQLEIDALLTQLIRLRAYGA